MSNSPENELAKIRQNVKELLVSNLAFTDVLDSDEIEDDEVLFGEGLGLDSLDAVEIVVLLQKHYNIEIKDMDAGREILASVDSLARYIQKNSSKDVK